MKSKAPLTRSARGRMKKASERPNRTGKVGKSLNESKREEESRNERAREWGGLKANHVAPRDGSRTSARNGWRRIATVSRIRMLRTPYNGHSSKFVRTALFNEGGRGSVIFRCKSGLNDTATVT